MKIVVIGGVAGGASFAARMRRLDESAEITIIEKSEYIAFANCGLPFYISGVIPERSSLVLYTPDIFEKRLKIAVKTQTEAISIDKENKNVTVKNVITGETQVLPYDKLVLSTGASPVKPPIPGVDEEGVFTLRNIPDVDKIKEYIKVKNPRSAVVIGGGYIGLEMVENIHLSGIKTTVIEMADHVVTSLDSDMASFIHLHMREKGVELILNTKVEKIEKTDSGFKVSAGGVEYATDMVIMSVGVRPDTKLAVESGLKTTPSGAVIVNDHMLTSDANIYCVGDASITTDFITKQPAYIPLAGPANRQGRMVADIIGGIDRSYQGTQGSAILRVFDLTVASTGMCEKQAAAQNIPYSIVFINSNSHAEYYPNATKMWIKGIFDKSTRKLIGAQIVGKDGVDKRCDVLATAIRAGMTAEDLTELELCYAPPYSSAKDPVNILGYAMSNILSGLVKVVDWNFIEKLPKDGSVSLLDVRDNIDEGTIKGFVHIPFGELRDKLNQLDKSKPVYIHCNSGHSSYLACRVLTNYGYDCYNIIGGFKYYNALKKDAEAKLQKG